MNRDGTNGWSWPAAILLLAWWGAGAVPAAAAPPVASAPITYRETALPVFYQWGGSKGRPLGDRPFFLIRDLDTLIKFFARIPFEESLPHVDFAKTMVFVGCPGPTLFDYQPMKVVGFYRNDLRYCVVLDLDRHQTGGYWRNPYVVALLPVIPAADVDIMRVGNARKGEPTRVPLFTIWDTSRQRTDAYVPGRPWQAPKTVKPLPTYGFDLSPKPPEYIVVMEAPQITVTNANQVAQPMRMQKTTALPPLTGAPPRAAATPAGSRPPAGQATKPPETPATRPTPPPAQGTGTTGTTPTPPPTGQTTASASSGTGSDPFGDAFNLDF